MTEINETTRFDCIKVGEQNIMGSFKLVAPSGDLIGASGLFVVEEATGKCWPMTSVIGIRVAPARSQAPARNGAAHA